MQQYIFKKKTDGINIINLKKTWEKLVLAARAIAAVENPQDVFVVASRPYAQRAVLKFARYIGCSSIAGRFTPGAFTNQIQAAFREPRLLLISDPRSDHQPVTEASYANIPIVAFTNVDPPKEPPMELQITLVLVSDCSSDTQPRLQLFLKSLRMFKP